MKTIMLNIGMIAGLTFSYASISLAQVDTVTKKTQTTTTLSGSSSTYNTTKSPGAVAAETDSSKNTSTKKTTKVNKKTAKTKVKTKAESPN